MNRNVTIVNDHALADHLKWNSYLSERKKLLYVATPKVACTSIKWWFAALEGVSREILSSRESNESDPDLVVHDGFAKVAPSVTGLSVESLQDALSSDEFFRFAVVRNPYKRIFSAWQSKLLLREPLQAPLYRDKEFYSLPIDSYVDIRRSFEAFLLHLMEFEVPQFWDVHWTPQASLLRPDLISYTAIGKIENVGGLEAALLKHLGTGFVSPFLIRRANESLIPYDPGLISEKSVALIQELYEADFSLFDYPVAPPPASEAFSEDQLKTALAGIRMLRGRHQRLDEIRSVLRSRNAVLEQRIGEDLVNVGRWTEAVGEGKARIAELLETVSDRESQLSTLSRSLAEGDARNAALTQQLAERDARINVLVQGLTELESQINILSREMKGRDTKIVGLTQDLVECEARATEFAQALSDREARIDVLMQEATKLEARAASLAMDLNERDSKIVRLTQDAVADEARSTELAQAISEREVRINVLMQDVTKLEARAATLANDLTERDSKDVGLAQDVADCEARVAELTQALSEREVRLSMQSDAIAERDARIRDLLRSTSWRVTEPMRMLKRFVRQGGGGRAADSQTKGRRGIRPHCSNWIRAVYRRAPIRIETKIRIKGSLYSALPTVFSGTKGYQDWARHMRMLGAPVEQRYERPTSQESSGQLAPARARVSAVEQDDAFVGEARLSAKVDAAVTLVAFYLPQFHPIPENDAWWGRGFTEWANVSRALPQFEGHYQPHLPGELGFYDLRLPDVQARQVELAKGYGVGAFCFYFYWFGGKTLLEAPVEQYLAHSEFDLPFCLCWANENWSRRWDGLDAEILIGQDHSPDDDLAFIAHIAKYLRDPRYLRIDGRPVLLLYRPSLLPDAMATAMRWRQWAREAGLGELYLVYPQSFETADPGVYGFDAATEFPPNLSGAPVVTDSVTLLNPDFSGIAYDWSALVERSEQYAAPDYKLFRGVCPSWDNEARRTGRGAAFVNSNPADYERWLRNAVDDTCARFERRDERLVFVNAWNEWAEGAHLEPDRRYGYAWLEATRRALTSRPAAQRKIVIVTHDAHPHGAQYLALHMAEEFVASLKFEVAVVCLGDGILKERFAKVATLIDLAGIDQGGEDAAVVACQLRAAGYDAAIVNTTASGRFLPLLHAAGLRCIALIHELESVITGFNLQEHAKSIAAYADAVVFPAPAVRDSFVSAFDVPESRIRVRHQGLYKRNRYVRVANSERREKLRAELGISGDAVVVLGVGYADRRKGVDLFVEAALHAAQRDERLHFVWVGHWSQEMTEAIAARLDRNLLVKDRFHFVGRRDDTDLFYAGADLFALTSREDPFPSVVMEAMEVGLPVVGFDGGGGFVSLLREGAGCVIPMGDVTALSDLFVRRALSPDEFSEIERAGPLLIQDRFSFRRYLYDLSDYAGCDLKRVSVVVPNFNYARFLPGRLASIANQDYPIYELIVLDDASTDESLKVASAWLNNYRGDWRLISREMNSGSVFAQWERGVSVAQGDYVWIAEADDLCEPPFISEVLRTFDANPDVVLSYCESKQMAQDGSVLCDNYLQYVSDVSPDRWAVPYVAPGCDEVRDALCVKNTVPNVSAAIMRRAALMAVLGSQRSALSQFKVAGDWFVYVNLALKGGFAFTPKPLNMHRRHPDSVTISRFNIDQLREIVAVQDWVFERFQLPESQRGRAAAYAQELYERFGLRTNKYPSYRDVLEASRISAPSLNVEDALVGSRHLGAPAI